MSLQLIPSIHRAAHRIGLSVEALPQPRVSQAEAHVLAHLAASGEATIGDVHRAFGHKRSTLTSILDRLEARKLIVRTSDTRDRRTFVLRLTRPGTTLANRVVAHLQAVETRVLQASSAADVRAFLRVVERFDASPE